MLRLLPTLSAAGVLLAAWPAGARPPRPAPAVAPPAPVLPFIDDDYPRARDTAARLGKPLFVDAWATWCHTCLSMRSYVFADPALAPWARQFVWLALDIEKDVNAAFVAGHPVDTLPMFMIIDPASEKTVRVWRGGLTRVEFSAWLDEAGAALPAADVGARARALDAQVMDLAQRRDHAACVQKALDGLEGLPPGTSRLDVAVVGFGCAREQPPGPARAAQEKPLAAALSAIVADPGYPVMADDKSSVFDALVEAKTQDGDPAGAHEIAAQWATFLEGEARRAPGPAARAVFDPHRLSAYLALGQPERAIPMLQQSSRDFPGDYNPPARLARALLAAHRLDEALATVEKALRLVYGPRRKRIVALKSDILKAGQPGGEQAAPGR